MIHFLNCTHSKHCLTYRLLWIVEDVWKTVSLQVGPLPFKLPLKSSFCDVISFEVKCVCGGLGNFAVICTVC